LFQNVFNKSKNMYKQIFLFFFYEYIIPKFCFFNLEYFFKLNPDIFLFKNNMQDISKESRLKIIKIKDYNQARF